MLFRSPTSSRTPSIVHGSTPPSPSSHSACPLFENLSTIWSGRCAPTSSSSSEFELKVRRGFKGHGPYPTYVLPSPVSRAPVPHALHHTIPTWRGLVYPRIRRQDPAAPVHVAAEAYTIPGPRARRRPAVLGLVVAPHPPYSRVDHVVVDVDVARVVCATLRPPRPTKPAWCPSPSPTR